MNGRPCPETPANRPVGPPSASRHRHRRHGAGARLLGQKVPRAVVLLVGLPYRTMQSSAVKEGHHG